MRERRERLFNVYRHVFPFLALVLSRLSRAIPTSDPLPFALYSMLGRAVIPLANSRG